MEKSHKHLGVTFSSDCKWNKHIDNIVKTTSMMVSSMRKLKFILNRDTLNKIYIVFIRPHLEYACELWDGCSLDLADKLEKVQFEAARIVTGLPRYAARESLSFETGWPLLKERRTCRKLSLFYKIYHKNAPFYLSDLMPLAVQNRTNYNLI